MKKILAMSMFSVMVVGAWLTNTNYQQAVGAQGCTIGGKSLTAGDGTLICDCTGAGSNCNCVVPCKPKGDGGEVPVDTGAN